jgi:hypothetical protein
MRPRLQPFAGALLACLLLATTPAAGAIEAATEDLREEQRQLREDPGHAPQSEKLAELSRAIARGEAASQGLSAQIDTLKEEKAKLERIQAILTSGLIGALVTAAVAMLGALSKLSGWRVERDLKRLEVIERAHRLAADGVRVPTDILRDAGADRG